MKTMANLTFLALNMSLISCSIGGISTSVDEVTAVSAPMTLNGKTYQITAKSGSGAFPKTGTFTVTFLSSQPWYTTKGDGVNFGDSWGKYTYSSSGASGTVKVDGSKLSKAVFSIILILLSLEHLS